MNLITGKLFWNRGVSVPCYPPLENDMICDVLVVGSGEAGAHIAYFLAKIGMSVMLIEKREIACGSTFANVGLLQFFHDKSLTSLIHTFGEEKGVRAYKLCYEALRTMEKFVPNLDIDPQFIPRNSLYYASKSEDVSSLQEEYNTLQKYGFPVEYFTEVDIKERYFFTKQAALYTHGDAEVNPYLLAHSLLHKANQMGAIIHEHTEALHIKKRQNDLICYTKTGNQIVAKNIIMATGYEALFGKKEKNTTVETSYAVVTNEIDQFEGWHERSLIWETARPYLYFRTYKNRIIVGGLDEAMQIQSIGDTKLLHKRDILINIVREMFPQYKNIQAEYYWAAAFGSSHDGLPILKEDKKIHNLFYALLHGGNGTVYGMVFAKIFEQLFTNKESEDFSLFNR
ncbi:MULTISPECIES: NAD(P)/FAD-dependent oxidoreductase [Bacillus cereus group]|uniref:FAD-dependent oxidoreductase n=1 Tax=Bacillus thuringiensis serovar mexicanensis TaxID=180868 RepID=A0A242W070_BACTU|nr:MULTISPECIES: FAD-dependent oxidoreductase [Bacillus cereus group]EEM60944.1 Oxidoreductase [Bacillus thuringiensis serovar monterrey BGSC 4AJ1]MEB9671205.1 FAD-dependent oxidoreductase [Bacillus anthracis]OTW44208.1 FAD-dependent oxidoreductase [Bacillus thuringiensis serovar mexicanensis]OTW99800.1 FAD-dependent oxidoreductase [Bacillus thuringiensis serovar monterrey]